MNNGRPLVPEQPHQLDEAEDVLARIDRALHVTERHVARTRLSRGISEPALPVSGDHDVELVDQRRKQRSDIPLGSAHLRERDQDEDARTAHRRS